MNIEEQIENELGKQGEKGSAKEDWREMQREIDSGRDRKEVLKEYLTEIQKQNDALEKQYQERKIEFALSEKAKNALLSSKEWELIVARKMYDKALIDYRKKYPKKKVRSFENWMKIIGYSIHEADIREAMYYECSFSDAAAKEYKIVVD